MPLSFVFGRHAFLSPINRSVAACFAFGCATMLRAHPEIEAALSRLNPLIEASPENAALYLDRGELYAQHEDWIQAEANYLRAAELTPRLPRLDRCRGRLALITGDPFAARAHLDRAVGENPADAEAFILRSRVRARLQDRAGALTDLNAALALVANPRPELFLERAALIAAVPDAIASLAEAIARIGPAHTLQLRALELEEAAGMTDAALTRIAALAAQSERLEIWLKRAGDILARANRPVEARLAYAAALAALESRPEWLRESPDSSRLATELRRLLTPAS